MHPTANFESAEPLVPPQPPPAPRPITRQVRRRAWKERHVRRWWLLSLLVLGVAVYYGVSRLYSWRDEALLISGGDKVTATVMGWVGGEAVPGQHAVLPPNTPVFLEFDHKGSHYRVFGELAGRNESVITRTELTLFVDRDNPNHWTGRSRPANLGHQLLGSVIQIPFFVVLLIAAIVGRRRVLLTYQQGEAHLAEVVETSHSAAAPLSRLVRCAMQAGEDARVVKVLLPTAQTPCVGETLWLFVLPSRPALAVPAALFESA